MPRQTSSSISTILWLRFLRPFHTRWLHFNYLSVAGSLPEAASEPAKKQPVKKALPAGLEPATYGLEIRCSIQLSYGSVGGILRDGGRLARQPAGLRCMLILHLFARFWGATGGGGTFCTRSCIQISARRKILGRGRTSIELDDRRRRSYQPSSCMIHWCVRPLDPSTHSTDPSVK